METIKIKIKKQRSIIWLSKLCYSILVPAFLFSTWRKKDTNSVTILLEHQDGIKLVYADGYKRHCYLVLAGFLLDYKEQVIITGIKSNLQYLICHILLKEREFITRLEKPQTNQST